MKKKLLTITVVSILCFAFAFALVACINQGGENPSPSNYTRPSNPNINNTFTATGNTLVAYFSKTNTTKGVAETIHRLTNADIFEIERKEPYPNSYTPTTEVAKEEKDNNARPELATYLPDEVMAQYDTIILGFPIWWHTAPMAVLSFLNYYDLSGKTIYTFATSGGSPISESTADIRSNTKATVNEGRLFNGSNETTIRNWLDGLGLISSPEQPELPENPVNPPVNPDDNTPTIPDDEQPSDEPSLAESKVLIAYFSWSGTTTRLAEHVKTMLPNATLYQIERETPYEGSYNNVAYGEAKDEADNNARPPIKNPISVKEMSEYDAIIVMYPIWWHTAPMVVGTFFEAYDLSGKDIYPITQSASMNTSQFNQSYSFIKECATLNGRTPTVHKGLGTKDMRAIDTYLRQYGLIA